MALLLSLGSVNADFQVRIDRPPAPSETLVASAFARMGGGKAANRALVARRLGLEARLFGHVGADDLAEQALAALAEAGVALAGLRRLTRAGTAVSLITVPPDGRKGIVLAPLANDDWTEAEAEETTAAVAAAPPAAALALDAEIPPWAAERALRAAGDRLTVLDPSPADRATPALLRGAAVLTPNAGEAEALTGAVVGDDPRAAARAADRLREGGARSVCVKLASGGAVWSDQAVRLHQPAAPVEVADSTGAGDAFAGALAAALAEGAPPPEALALAVAVSSCAVRAFGSQPSYPDRAAAEAERARLPDAEPL